MRATDVQKYLAMLSFCIAYVKKSKIISVKKLPPVGIEPGTLGFWDLLYCTLIPS